MSTGTSCTSGSDVNTALRAGMSFLGVLGAGLAVAFALDHAYPDGLERRLDDVIARSTGEVVVLGSSVTLSAIDPEALGTELGLPANAARVLALEGTGPAVWLASAVRRPVVRASASHSRCSRGRIPIRSRRARGRSGRSTGGGSGRSRWSGPEALDGRAPIGHVGAGCAAVIAGGRSRGLGVAAPGPRHRGLWTIYRERVLAAVDGGLRRISPGGRGFGSPLTVRRTGRRFHRMARPARTECVVRRPHDHRPLRDPVWQTRAP